MIISFHRFNQIFLFLLLLLSLHCKVIVAEWIKYFFWIFIFQFTNNLWDQIFIITFSHLVFFLFLIYFFSSSFICWNLPFWFYFFRFGINRWLFHFEDKSLIQLYSLCHLSFFFQIFIQQILKLMKSMLSKSFLIKWIGCIH